MDRELRKSVKLHKKSCTEQRKIIEDQTSSSQSRQKIKAKKVVDNLSSNLKHELEFGANDRFSGQLKSSASHYGQCLEESSSKDDELVKYMSNLPGYLRTEDEKCQENILNVGVLDWAQLEKWKCKQRHLQAKVGKHGSFVPIMSDDKLSHKSKTRNVKPTSQRPMCLVKSEVVPETTLKELLDIDKREEIDIKVSSKMETPLSTLSDCKISQGSKHYGRFHNTEAEETLYDVMKRDDDFCADAKASPSVFRIRDVSSSSVKKESTKRNKTKRRVKKSFDPKISLDNPDCHGEQKNIVLLFPKYSQRHKFAKNPYLEPGVQSAKGLTRESENVTEQNEKQILHGLSKEKVNSIKLHSEIPHSSSIKSTAEGNAEKYIKPYNLNTKENCKSSDTFCKLSLSNEKPSKLPEDKSVKQCTSERTVRKSVEEKAKDKCKSNMMPTNSRLDRNLKVLDQETAGLKADEESRFLLDPQFSVPRMGRSLSLKEGARVPHLSSNYVSVRSGPVYSELATEFGTSNGDKVNDNKISKFGPVRRLLEPLRKSKRTRQPQSIESIQPLKDNFDLDFEPVYSSGSINGKRDDETIVQATLQLTMQNNLPFYKLLINNGSDILLASTELLNVPAKDECGKNYTSYYFGRMNEKNGSWFTQRSKERTCGYTYKVIGQMKVSDYPSIDLFGECTNNHHLLREAVLFSVEQRQVANDLPPELILNQELAAVVIKDFTEVLCNGVELSEKHLNKSCTESFIEDSCICKIRRSNSEACKNTTVILPGEFHGMPQIGGPSSLIERWKTGGLCDCGGWDVGCKLRILNNCCKSHITSKCCSLSASNFFELYDEAKAQQERPTFSLVPSEEGTYTVKFNASITVLQAFFICVAVLSNKNLSSVSRVTDLAESKLLQGNLQKNGEMGCPAIISVQGSYVPPPNSPVGRA